MKLCHRINNGTCCSPVETQRSGFHALRVTDHDGARLVDLCVPCLDWVARQLAKAGRKTGRLGDPSWRPTNDPAAAPIKILSSKPITTWELWSLE